MKKKYEYDLTISIIAFKNYDQIINAVNSINKYSSSYTKEIIVVDNTEKKSFHDSKLIKELKKLTKLDNVKLIRNYKNIGFGHANNIALKHAKGRYFVICNPDILLIEPSFNFIVPYLDTNYSIGAVVPKLVDENLKLEPVYRRELTLFDIIIRYFNPFNVFKKRRAYHVMQDKDYNYKFSVPFAQGSFIVIRTKLMKKLKGFDERYFMYVEDADLCKRINEVSNLEYLPDTTVIHLWNKESHRNMKLTFYHLQSLIKYFVKWNKLGKHE